MSDIIYCQYCGKQNSSKARFCENCGKKLSTLNDHQKHQESLDTVYGPSFQRKKTISSGSYDTMDNPPAHYHKYLHKDENKQSPWLWLIIAFFFFLPAILFLIIFFGFFMRFI